MCSHELRNPLSAVIQCADSSIESLHILAKVAEAHSTSECTSDMKTARDEIASALDALQTIISCSIHQKRIIDDILTLSKVSVL